jgi:hypothetical protein
MPTPFHIPTGSETSRETRVASRILYRVRFCSLAGMGYILALPAWLVDAEGVKYAG